jgi:flagellar protein FlaF
VAGDTTLLVDNEYVDVGGATATTTVDGNGDTELWLEGETLTIEVAGSALSSEPSGETRVVLVVESGVRDAAEVSA